MTTERIWEIVVFMGALAAMLLNLSGCGRETQIAGFESYVADFEAAALDHGRRVEHGGLVIVFGQPRDAARAVCDHGPLQNPTITVRNSNWSMLNEVAREELIFHELGHCLLGRGHESEMGADGAPKSLMFPGTPEWAAYANNRAAYLAELFK